MTAHSLKRAALTALLFALASVLLFYLSGALVGNQTIGGIASLVFLPAFIRLLGFLVIGYWIVPALFLAGAYLSAAGAYDIAPGLYAELLITGATAVGGPLGVAIVSRWIKLEATLANLTPLRLLALSFGCSLGNAFFHHAGMISLGLSDGISEGTVSIFIGDMIGSWVIIYGLKAAMDFYARSRPS